MLREYAEEQSYVFTGPISISLEQDDELGTGRFRVRSAAVAHEAPPARERDQRRGTTGAPWCSRSTGCDTLSSPRARDRSRPRRRPADRRPGGVAPPRGNQVMPGAGAPSVSIVDLGSTNGMLVNGQRVQQAPLADGGTVRIGDTSMTVHFLGLGRAAMSELTLMLIRFAYLAILWTSCSRRSRWSGPTCRGPVEQRARAERREQRRSAQNRPKPAKRPRGAPTHVAVVDGANAGRRSLDEAPLLIGRGSNAAIRLDNDYVSTRHARIAASGEQWFVEDLGSTNGTYIGSQRISQPTTLQLGSQIRIGKTTFELRK